MKKLFLFSLLLVAALVVNAQENKPTTEIRAQKNVDRLTKQLDLTQDQQTQLFDLLVARQNDRKLRTTNRQELNKEAKDQLRAERKAAEENFNTEVARILTPAQNEKYQKIAQTRRAKGSRKMGKAPNGKKGAGKLNKKTPNKKGAVGKGKPNRKPNNSKVKGTYEERAQKRVDRYTEQLGLNETQQQQVYDLLMSIAPAVGKSDFKNMTKEEQKAVRAERQKNRENSDAAFEQILTPEQLETYKGMSKRRGGGKKKGKKK